MKIPKVKALVPMKGHSERVPKKNIRLLAGKPAFHWIIEALENKVGKVVPLEEITKTLDSYLILNTSISKTMFKFLKLSVGAKNLFDQDYATQFGYTMNDLDYPMPGRTFSGRLSIQY